MRGYQLSDEDRLRRTVISRLLCHTVVIKNEISREFGIDFDEHFAEELLRLEPSREDGLVLLNNGEILATWLGRIFIRNLAIVFDPYLEKQQLIAKPLFSKTLSSHEDAYISVTRHVAALVVGRGISGLVCAYALRQTVTREQPVDASRLPC